MTPKAKARKIGRILEDLYPVLEIPLQHSDPFTLLVAVVLSAQTTDKAVNGITPALFKLASTPAQMAALKPEQVLTVIRSLGLAPQKSRHLVALAQRLLDHFGGRVPSTLAEEFLPGVGHKTASVVMCQAFGQAAFPVDTHIHRLAARWGLSSGKSVIQTEADLKRLFPESSWSRLHLQLIYFGREHCPARGHQPERCPICSWAASTFPKGHRAPHQDERVPSA